MEAMSDPPTPDVTVNEGLVPGLPLSLANRADQLSPQLSEAEIALRVGVGCPYRR